MALPYMEPIYIAFGIFLLVTVIKYLKPQNGRNYTSLDTEKAKDMLERQNILIIDVRNKDAYKEGHINGAENIPLDQLDKRMTKLSRDKDIVVYCQTGSRSIRAIRKLEIAGFTRLYHMHQGLRGWKNLGYPYGKGQRSK